MRYKSIQQNKRGWIKIVEAFVAILLIAGFVLTILNKGYIKKDDSSSEIYNIEITILQDIQSNNSLRQEILNTNPLPVNWSDFPPNVKNKIILDPPAYLECEGKICELSDSCLLEKSIDEDIYSRSVLITSTLTNYNPRQLKMFCWGK